MEGRRGRDGRPHPELIRVIDAMFVHHVYCFYYYSPLCGYFEQMIRPRSKLLAIPCYPFELYYIKTSLFSLRRRYYFTKSQKVR